MPFQFAWLFIASLHINSVMVYDVLYISIYRISQPIRRTIIFLLEILEKNDDEYILILVIYWKKTGLLCILLRESKPFTSSDARSHDLEANFTVSR
jgi:hypothetical protein